MALAASGTGLMAELGTGVAQKLEQAKSTHGARQKRGKRSEADCTDNEISDCGAVVVCHVMPIYNLVAPGMGIFGFYYKNPFFCK
jgi:hypothetical protein